MISTTGFGLKHLDSLHENKSVEVNQTESATILLPLIKNESSETTLVSPEMQNTLSSPEGKKKYLRLEELK